jgi:GNAT superfamily N-acetyltransferase
VEIREGCPADAEAMSDVLQELVAAGNRTKAATPNFALSHYIEHPHRLHCFVALDDYGKMLGFQSLKLAHETNAYGTPAGWGIIGTHVRPSAARTGVGSRLFAETLVAAHEIHLPAIEAYIGKDNSAALAYYHGLGFRTHRHADQAICKSYQFSRSCSA